MPRLACFRCGRQLYSVAPMEALLADERRCPRCGAYLSPDRRETDRRWAVRRENPTALPGPPAGVERRGVERRKAQRRRIPGSSAGPGAA